jgi:hypothetical protein
VATELRFLSVEDDSKDSIGGTNEKEVKNLSQLSSVKSKSDLSSKRES